MSYIDTLIDDMALFHDAPCDVLGPGGVSGTWGSGYNWPYSNPCPDGWVSGNMWFHCMETTGVYANQAAASRPWRMPPPYTGNQAPNTRVQIADLQLWFLLPDGRWQLDQYRATPTDQMYNIDWSDEHYTGDFRVEPPENGGGGSMLNIGRGEWEDYNWHGWTTSKPHPTEYLGFASCCYARKILDDPNGPDDRSQAQLLLALAGDWYRYATTGHTTPVVGNVVDKGFSRLKYPTTEWQLFGFYSTHSLSQEQIRANPPPFIGLERIDAVVPDPDPPTDPVLPQLPGRSQGVWTPKIVSGYEAWAAHEAIVASAVRRRRRRRKY